MWLSIKYLAGAFDSIPHYKMLERELGSMEDAVNYSRLSRDYADDPDFAEEARRGPDEEIGSHYKRLKQIRQREISNNTEGIKSNPVVADPNTATTPGFQQFVEKMVADRANGIKNPSLILPFRE